MRGGTAIFGGTITSNVKISNISHNHCGLFGLCLTLNCVGMLKLSLFVEGYFMKAIEFSGNVKDGIVKIPKKFLSNLSDESVRVIILVKDQSPSKKALPLKKRFKSASLDTRGFKFNRNEANER